MTLDLLAISPHPDDVELHCGGLLLKMSQKGHATGIVDLTAGEMSTRGTAEDRVRETADASAILGLAARENLAIPDARVAVTDEQKLAVIRVIRKYRPRILLLPSRVTRHPDHGHTSELTREAAFLAGLEKIDTEQEAYRPQQLIYYFTHYTYRDQPPSFVVDVSDQYQQKLEAIRAYRSQFHNPSSMEPETFITRPEFLDELEVQNRYYGALIGVRHGEPYIIREYLAIDDPVGYFRDIRER